MDGAQHVAFAAGGQTRADNLAEFGDEFGEFGVVEPESRCWIADAPNTSTNRGTSV
jgi:hypothetical protein